MIPSDRELLHVIPQEYRVDNTTGKNPVGMCGVRLESKAHIVTGSISLIQNLVKCVEQTGVHAEHIVLQPIIASSEAVLSEEEKDLGVVLVDIGGGTTDLAIWKDGSLIHSQIIPVGGNHFTNDLAIALKVPMRRSREN